MEAIRVIVLCVAAALICTLLRRHRPELATMISLAVGIGVLLMYRETMQQIVTSVKRFMDQSPIHSEYASAVRKAAGISILSELGVQICCDAGESALAGRIRLACRMIMLALALPGLNGILDLVASIS